MGRGRDRAGRGWCALAFAVPGLVMLGVYASLGLAPWGDRTVLDRKSVV